MLTELAIAMAALVFWLSRRKRQGKPTLLDPDLFKSKHFRLGISQQMLQQIALGGTMIALPILMEMPPSRAISCWLSCCGKSAPRSARQSSWSVR